MPFVLILVVSSAGIKLCVVVGAIAAGVGTVAASVTGKVATAAVVGKVVTAAVAGKVAAAAVAGKTTAVVGAAALGL